MGKPELQKLINQIIKEEFSQSYLDAAEKVLGLGSPKDAPKIGKSPIWVRATGQNRYAGGSKDWLLIRKINKLDSGEYELVVQINGREKSVGIRKNTPTPNLEFQLVNGKPLAAADVINSVDAAQTPGTGALKESVMSNVDILAKEYTKKIRHECVADMNIGTSEKDIKNILLEFAEQISRLFSAYKK